MTLIQRVGRCLERQGLLEQDTESTWLDLDPAERHAARACPAVSGMTEAQRLKRVFNIDIETCAHCGGPVKVIACIEEQDVIDKILAHLHKKEQADPALPLLTSPSRAPPETLALFPEKDSGPTALDQQGRQ